MKKFKQIDLVISATLIIGLTCWWLIAPSIGRVIMSYLITGGWQVISMLVHAYHGGFTAKGSTRYVYHWIVFISLITMPLGSVWILLFAAPLMAVFYAGICYDETLTKHTFLTSISDHETQ